MHDHPIVKDGKVFPGRQVFEISPTRALVVKANGHSAVVAIREGTDDGRPATISLILPRSEMLALAQHLIEVCERDDEYGCPKGASLPRCYEQR